MMLTMMLLMLPHTHRLSLVGSPSAYSCAELQRTQSHRRRVGGLSGWYVPAVDVHAVDDLASTLASLLEELYALLQLCDCRPNRARFPDLRLDTTRDERVR